MILEIITPEAIIIHTDVDLVSVPSINGEFQILNNHAPIVSLLVKGTVKFKGENITIEEKFRDTFTKNKGKYSVAIKSGTVEVKENKISILVD